MNENGDVELGEEDGILVDESGNIEDSSAKVSKRDEDQSIEERNAENAELSEAETDEEREAIRERRRKERKHRKQVSKEREQAKDRLVSSLQLQVQDLSARLSQVDKKQSGTDFARLEEELNQAIATANEAKEHLKNAAEAKDGEGVAEATDLYYTARRRAEYLATVKKQITSSVNNRSNQLDSRVVDNATKWMRDNSWYRHNGDDADSITTKMVDDQLASEGYDPRTKEYWEELNDRLSDKLPHRFAAKAKGRNLDTPVVSGTGKNSPSGNSGTGAKKFFLSAERVKALKETGDWDDPKRREAMIKRYQAYDQENKGGKS